MSLKVISLCFALYHSYGFVFISLCLYISFSSGFASALSTCHCHVIGKSYFLTLSLGFWIASAGENLQYSWKNNLNMIMIG